ncbi:MAG: dihydrofolate reductase [Bacteroidia bacterium]|nr:dihydrofolate reductase [Bacteroidia bacterium]
MDQIISAIYAVSENGVIGVDNDLPWRLPNDLKFFKSKTIGKPIIMGRKSFESIGKALPKRRNIVLTRNKDFHAKGIEVYQSLEEALAACKEEAEVCITGGAGVYEKAINEGYVNLIYETLVHAEIEGDTYFKLANPREWKIVEVDARQADDKHEYAYTFRTLKKA